jgi:hypothetical protein
VPPPQRSHRAVGDPEAGDAISQFFRASERPTQSMRRAAPCTHRVDRTPGLRLAAAEFMHRFISALAGLALLSLEAACSSPKEERTSATRLAASLGAPEISPDFAIAQPILGVRRDAPIAAVSHGPTGYLVLAELPGSGTRYELLATRVRFDGSSTNPSGAVVAETEGTLFAWGVKVARTGDHWLVAYGGTAGGMAIPVSDDGQLGTAVSLPITRVTGISWDGQRALVTSGPRGVFVDALGAPIGASFDVFPAVNNAGGSVAFDGTHHVVAWFSITNPASVNVTSVASSGPTGQTLSLYSVARATATTSGADLIAGSGSSLALYTASPPSCALGGRCTPLVPYYRALTTASGGAISAGTEQQLDEAMSGVRWGNDYLLYASRNGYVRFLDASGMPTGSPGTFLAPVSAQYFEEFQTTYFGLAPAADHSGFLSFSGPFAGRVSAAFALLDDPLLKPLIFPAAQSTPAATFDGQNYLAVWNDSGRGGIHAAHVSKAGAVLDATPFSVALGEVHDPFAASRADGSLVGWLTSNAVGAARVSTSGAVNAFDLSPLASPYVIAAGAAAGPNGYLLALGVPVVAADPPAMRAALLGALGSVSSPIAFDAQAAEPSVTYDGQNYVVVWCVKSGGTGELRAARFTPAFELVDSTPEVLFQDPASDFDLAPLVASNGAQSLVAWTQSGDGSIRVSRVSRELDVLDPGGVLLTDDAAFTRGVAVAWDGTRYWFVWQGGLANDGRHVVLHGRRVGADGAPVDPAPFVVTNDLLDLRVVPNRLVGMASDLSGSVLVTYVKDDSAARGNTVRARRLSTPAPQGGAGGTSGGGGGGSGGSAGGGAGGVAGTTGGGGGMAGSTGGSGGIAGSSAGEGGDAGETGEAGAETGGAGAAGEAGAGQGGEAGSTGGSGGRGGSATGGRAGEGAHAGDAGAGDAGAAGESGGEAGQGGGGSDDSGCGCSIPERTTSFGALWSFALAAVYIARRRRRGWTTCARR